MRLGVGCVGAYCNSGFRKASECMARSSSFGEVDGRLMSVKAYAINLNPEHWKS